MINFDKVLHNVILASAVCVLPVACSSKSSETPISEVSAFETSDERTYISELFSQKSIAADHFDPIFLSQVPLKKIHEMMSELNAQIGAPIETKGKGKSFVVTTETHTVDVVIVLNEEGNITGLLVSPPKILKGASLSTVVNGSVSFEKIVGKYAISTATKSRTTVEFYVKDDALFFKNPGGRQLKVSVSDTNEYSLKRDKLVKFIFPNTNDESLKTFTIDQHGRMVTFISFEALQEQVDRQSNYTNVTAKTADYVQPENLNDGLVLASLSDVTMKEKQVYKLMENINAGDYGEIDSLLIMKDGKLVVEKYGKYWSEDQPHLLQSISKSITSLLVGSAIEQGYIKSVKDPIQKYLPEYKNLFVGGKESLTIEHLLTMTSGLEWNEAKPPYSSPKNIRVKEATSEDGIAFILSRPLINTPGEVFNYNGGNVTVIGEIIKNATGANSVLDYLKSDSRLAALDFGALHWQSQSDGRQNTAGGVAMRPRDLLKIGQAVLENGNWQNQTLLSENWIEASLENHIATPKPDLNTYGYYWWGRDYDVGGHVYHESSAQGYGGQELLIVKELDLVIVINATNYDRPVSPTKEMMLSYILPAFVK